MHCFCCDMLLDVTSPIDTKTGRYYCAPCFEPTVEAILAQDRKDFIESLVGQDQGLDDVLEFGDVEVDDYEIDFEESLDGEGS